MTDSIPKNCEVRLQGVSICPGIAIGCARTLGSRAAIPQDEIDVSEIAVEQDRYSCAVDRARQNLPQHIASVHGQLSPEAQAIYSVHEAILADESFHAQVRSCIAAKRRRAAYCVDQQAATVMAALNATRDPYFKARSEDIRDMAYNLLGVLSNGDGGLQHPLTTEDVVISPHLHSSSVFTAYRGGVAGFASESQALTSHAAIVLKGFAIPSVGSVSGLLDTAYDGDRMIVDGNNGVVIVRPSPRTEAEYVASAEAAETPIDSGKASHCLTVDGTKIVLRANIENPKQIPLMLSHGLDGIGLFRTEFMIAPEGRIPPEDQQCAIYRRIFTEAAGRYVTIRTFDIGADKQFGLTGGCVGPNPALGLRGIRRHLLKAPAELHTQLRAILRAAIGNDFAILLPMVTTQNDIARTKHVLNEIEDELRGEGVELPKSVALGAMIEVPAAAISVQQILTDVDFISVGTNDLLQYFMAADRDNERVVQYHDPTDPAFLWLLEHIITQAAAAGREADVSVCGEIASDRRMLPHLLRLGYHSLSISPVAAPTVRATCEMVQAQSDG